MPQDDTPDADNTRHAQHPFLLYLVCLAVATAALSAEFFVSFSLLRDHPGHAPGLVQEVYGIFIFGLLALAVQAVLVHVLLLRPLREARLRIAHLNQALDQRSHRDPLTGALNRTAFEHMALRELESLRRYGLGLCGIMLDVDGFRRVNEQLGYELGDQALVELAQLLKHHVRKADCVFRWRSGKFLILASGIDEEQARRFADKLRFLIEAAPTEHIVLRAENRHLTVDGIARCLERLLACPDCSLVHGAHVWVRQKRGKLEAWPCYNGDGLAGLMQERPEERLLAAFNPMVSLYYAVERRQNLLDVLDLAPGIDNLNAFEILLTAVKAINGKCARVPVLFCAVQERPSALKASPLYDGFDLVASRPEYAEQYRLVRGAIARHLALKSGLGLPRCEALTQESLDHFLRNHCAKPRRSAGEKLRRKAGKLAASASRLLGLPDLEARRVLDAYLAGLEGDAPAGFQALLATIERGYREGW